jgi:hypothetical protein
LARGQNESYEFRTQFRCGGFDLGNNLAKKPIPVGR